MQARGGVERIPLQISRACVVASIQVDLNDEVMRQFRDDLLELLHRSGLLAVILDVSGIDIMDAEDFRSLRKIIAMAQLMGSRCIVAGLQAGVVASLVELDLELEDIETTLDLDTAFEALESGTEEGRGVETPIETDTDWDQLLVGTDPIARDLRFVEPEDDGS